MCIYIYIHTNVYIYIYKLARVKVLYIWVVAIVMVIAFGGGPIAFQGFGRNQHIQDPTWSQNPFLNRLGSIEELFCWCQVLWQQFILLSFCIHVLSCFFHAPFMFLSCCIDVFSCSFHLHASSFHSAFISFHFVSLAMEMGLWRGQRTKCNKWLSLSYR